MKCHHVNVVFAQPTKSRLREYEHIPTLNVNNSIKVDFQKVSLIKFVSRIKNV